MAIAFQLNGLPHRITDLRPSLTVLDLLREHMHLSGTKEGCAEGDCGACTIAVRPLGAAVGAARWRPVNSCLMLLAQLDGLAIRTVEGLAGGGRPHPVQAILAESDGTQCGFCTPGIVMSLFALWENGEAAGEGALHEALAGNLCRCTGYRPVLDAARAIVTRDKAMDEAPGDGAGSGAGLPAADTTGQDAAPPPVAAAGGELHLLPRTLADLVAARAADPEAILIAGATDLGLLPAKGRRGFAKAIWTGGVGALKQISQTDSALTIGAAVTYEEALAPLTAAFPAFGALIRRIGSRQIRALGTLGGNLGTASPVGDTLPVLMVLDAAVELQGPSGARRLPVADFITGYRRTALAADEVIAAIHIPRLGPGEELFAYKLSRRFDQDISILLAAFRLRREAGRLALFRAAYGGLAERAKRAPRLEAVLDGADWSAEALAEVPAALAADFTPRDDHRASAGYRRRAAANLLHRLLIETTAPHLPARLEAL